ncbi:hypothetical protein TH25_17805 [Thalassospira profundimaris]|uniref:Uncharacterized protein n=1 Tax=Thalassospira profundimaris TaxID=502049 RepID=A0A367WYM8_9PROT|nr:hypothetical protein TH25_17805 [Thalassospira profundimaris]
MPNREMARDGAFAFPCFGHMSDCNKDFALPHPARVLMKYQAFSFALWLFCPVIMALPFCAASGNCR